VASLGFDLVSIPMVEGKVASHKLSEDK